MFSKFQLHAFITRFRFHYQQLLGTVGPISSMPDDFLEKHQLRKFQQVEWYSGSPVPLISSKHRIRHNGTVPWKKESIFWRDLSFIRHQLSNPFQFLALTQLWLDLELIWRIYDNQCYQGYLSTQSYLLIHWVSWFYLDRDVPGCWSISFLSLVQHQHWSLVCWKSYK